MASVREQYSAALANAQAGGSTAGWVERDVLLYATDESGAHVGDPIGTGRELGFEPDAFTAWYIAQPGLQHKAFGDFYGASHTTYGHDESGARRCVDIAFDNPNWHAPSIGVGFGFSAIEHRELVSFALDGAPKLNDDRAVGFDFEAGWSTSQANLHQDKDWFFTLVQMVIMGTVAWASAGTLGPAVAGSMGMSTAAAGTAATAATLTTGGMIVSAAVVGATTSLVSGILNDNLSLKGVLIGALSGALTVGLLQGVGAVAGNLSTVGAIAARTTVQGAVQALLGGSFKDGAIAGFASGLADAVSVNMKGSIEAAFKSGAMTAAEATAARTFARLIGSAIRAAASPGDPGQAFASAFLDDVLRQVDLRAPVPGAPVSPLLASNDASGSGVTPNDPTPPATTPAPALAPALAPTLAPVLAPAMPREPMPRSVYESAADVGGLASLDSQASADGVKYLGPDGRVYDTPQPPVVVVGQRMTADAAAAYDAASLRASTALASAALAGEVWTLEALLAQGARWFGRVVAGLGELANLVPEIGLRTAGVGVSLLTLPGNAGQGAARVQIGENERFEKLPGALYGVLQQRDGNGDWQTVKTGVRLWEVGNQRMALTDAEIRALNAPMANPAVPRKSPPLITPLPSDRDQVQPLPGMSIDPPAAGSIPGYEAMPPLTIEDLLIERSSAEQRRFRNWLIDEAKQVDPSFDPSGYDAHHAIPLKEFPRLDALRIKLAELGVDINDPSINGVLLPRGKEAVGTTPHGDTQNNPEYWRETLERFRGVGTRDRALVVLAEMRNDLRDGKFVEPKPKAP